MWSMNTKQNGACPEVFPILRSFAILWVKWPRILRNIDNTDRRGDQLDIWLGFLRPAGVLDDP